MNEPLLEACVESLKEAVLAEMNGADQIELCARLDLDGITPPANLVEQCARQLRIPVKVMIRPHGGAFRYNDEELEEMEGSIAQSRNAGAFGVVFGFLNSDQTVDLSTTKRFLALGKDLDITFHKAIDLTPDPVKAVCSLNDLGVKMNILTSGGAETALDGLNTLQLMKQAATPNIKIIPAGRITQEVVELLHPQLGASTYHGRRIVPLQ